MHTVDDKPESINACELDSFTKAYIECALWTSELDANYSIEDIAPVAIERITDDCCRFQDQNSHLWAGCKWDRSDSWWSIDEQAGHDFWLTRNGHGTGFWDRDSTYGKSNAIELTGKSEDWGPVEFHIGDDGKIYQGA